MKNKAKLIFDNYNIDVLVTEIIYNIPVLVGEAQIMTFIVVCEAGNQEAIIKGFMESYIVNLYFNNNVYDDFFIEAYTLDKDTMCITIKQVRRIKNLNFKIIFDDNKVAPQPHEITINFQFSNDKEDK